MPWLVEPVVAAGTLANSAQPEIAGDGLVLRPWRLDDVPAVTEAYSDPEIQQWHARSVSTPAEAERRILERALSWRDETGADWAVASDSAVVGRVAFNRVDLHEGWGKLGYWVLPRARGAGVASASVIVLSRWALSDLGLHRIELLHSTRNPRSCRVAQRAEYLLEGTMRGHTLHPDGWHDMHLHARLATDASPPARAT